MFKAYDRSSKVLWHVGKNCPLSSVVELLICNQTVVGSSPTGGSNETNIGRISTVERELGFLELATDEVIMP